MFNIFYFSSFYTFFDLFCLQASRYSCYYPLCSGHCDLNILASQLVDPFSFTLLGIVPAKNQQSSISKHFCTSHFAQYLMYCFG